MPGRQAHGRSLTTAPKAKAGGKKGSKARSQKNALNAFGIAQDMYPTKSKKTPRARELDAEMERKHGRDEGDDEDGGEEEEQPRKKKAKGPSRAGDDAEYGSDSEGNEWQLGGLRDDDEDSEIESDDAFGDSDNEKFQEYSFRGSKAKPDDDSEDDSNDDEGETLGADAIDLATALDQWEEESDEEPQADDESGSGDSDEDEDDSDEDSDQDSGSDDDEDDNEVDPEKLNVLQGLISEYGGEEEDSDKIKSSCGQKLSLGDLGLTGLNDPLLKKSVKLMNKESKEKRPGVSQKLVVPLSRREQGRVDRSVAFDKTNETLNRWTETVKQNRRAEHLVFPLPQNSAMAGMDTTEIQPLASTNPSNELESTILSIMEQSGLSMQKEPKPKAKEYDEDGNELSRKEALAKKRMERELISRETKRAKRIKKIKSKAYHRVHRRQRERDELVNKEDGEVDSEEEQEAQDRRRALERVGQRHKESKWAKIGSKNKRAVWDDDFRAGLTEMARRDEELRRRKEGKAGAIGDSDSDTTSSSGSDDDDDADIRRQLKELEEGDDEPQSKLMSMKFMQNAEAAKKKANDDLIRQIRRDLDGEDTQDSEEEAEEVGRRSYGNGATDATSKHAPKRSRSSPDPAAADEGVDIIINNNQQPSATAESDSTGGAWLSSKARRKKTAPILEPEVEIAATKSQSKSKSNSSSFNSNSKSQSKSKLQSSTSTKPEADAAAAESNADSDSDSGSHHPFTISDQALLNRAFAGEEVVAEFAREKEEVAEADDDKVIDNTLPGWGSWVGDGVSNREKRRHQGRFLTKVEGIKKSDRKDAKLDRVIINEKRIKKNDRYLASQLPHSYESRQQYERSLRLPVGPEWMTKETFQDSTKPRVLMKQGVIAPISKPTA
ncbi:hypothetical protein QQS21_006835 [Conoideocrella luteorostrata]|uniref:Utp14-domain-containing protein n=1 Tax=Conoideocrella luteorostrata TaxID=1105319 RepID=A0AAJ0FZX2_9HYPO|nr:hypothetical protein QQS21_006835 [Conoideocrella luteorostrata]